MSLGFAAPGTNLQQPSDAACSLAVGAAIMDDRTNPVSLRA